MKDSILKKQLLVIIAISAIIRAFLAFSLELGNDEVYYWTYALYPDLSHFDHPPMVGWFIQLFTINLNLSNELFIRLSSVIIGSANIWVIYIIGRSIKGELTGFYSAILYTTSIYCSVISGVFILPDTPQSLFFLLSIYFLHEGLFSKFGECEESKLLCRFAMILAGVFIGLAMLSKYTSAFLWVGVGLYIILFDRKRLKDPILYLSIFISSLFLLPILIWNINNDFISFSFHSNRVSFFSSGFNPISFGREIIGNFIYNNPINVSIIIIALFSFRKRKFLSNFQYRFLLCLSIPLIVCFIFFSMFRDTLPHWSAPGYYALIVIAGAYLDDKTKRKYLAFPNSLKYSIFLILAVVLIGYIHIKTGLLNIETKKEVSEKIGKNDFTLDMYGWRKLSKDFKIVQQSDLIHGKMPKHSYILSYKWFPAAHLDYYIAHPNNTFVKTIGPINDTHKYAWITSKLGQFKLGESAYYLESSRDNFYALDFGNKYFKKVETAKIIYVKRLNKPVVRYTIYRFKELKLIPEAEYTSPPFKNNQLK